MTRTRAASSIILGLLGLVAMTGCATKSAHQQPPITTPVALGMIHETEHDPAEGQFVALGAGDSLGRMVFLQYAMLARSQRLAEQSKTASFFLNEPRP